MPFTGNRQFKQNPRMFVAAEGAYYTDGNGRKVFDGLSGLARASVPELEAIPGVGAARAAQLQAAF